MIKRKFSVILISAMVASLLNFSCASNPKTTDNATDEIDNDTVGDIEIDTEDDNEKTIKEAKTITVQDTSNQLENEFKKYLNELEIKIVSSPKKTYYAKTAFKEPYIISVTDSNGPAPDVNITISWPTKRTDDIISYGSTQLKTDSKGLISFIPEPSTIAVNDKISFYPTPVSSSPSIVKAAYNAMVTSEYVAKSSYVTYPGGILYVYDYNENSQPTTNNFTLLQALRNAGINAGNAPVSDTSYLDQSPDSLYKACKSIVGKEAKFLVVGSFKYAQPAEETSEGVICTLVADLTCIDMENGRTLYKTSITESATDKTKWDAEKKCRKLLANKAADAIIYGM